MSFSISAASPSNTTLDQTSDTSSNAKTPATRLTTNQEIHQLASSGQSASQIASSLGVPVSQVDSALGIKSSATSEASALVALSGRLSVKA